MRRRIVVKIIALLAVLLIVAGLVELAIVRSIADHANRGVRHRIAMTSLRLLRIAEGAGAIDERRLAEEFGALDGLGVAVYEPDGRLRYRSRSEDLPPLLEKEWMDEAVLAPDDPTFVDRVRYLVGGSSIMPLGGAPGRGFIGVFDRWVPGYLEKNRNFAIAGSTIAIGFIALMGALLAGAWLRRGLQQAGAVVHRISQGELSVRLPEMGDDEIGTLGADFNRMADRVEELVERLKAEQEAKRRVLADATHEIRTPLTSVLGYLEVLQEDCDDRDRLRRYLATAYRQARALAALVDDLDTLSRLETHPMELSWASVEVGVLLEGEVEAMRPRFEEARVALRFESMGRFSLRCDRLRVGQVVRIALTNALRHSSPEDVVLVRAVVSDATCAIEVEDHGEGIPREHLDRLGERFYRVDASRSRETGGRGLGLAIARGIVEAHGGTLELQSEVGLGTLVRAVLPLH